MAINFPNSPVNGNTYKYNDVTYIYSKNGVDEGYWKVALPQVSGVATTAEVDAGVDAVKYISPAALQGSKYLKGQTVKSFDTLELAVASTDTLLMFDGASITLKERSTGNGGGATWDVVLASGVTTNTYNIVACVGVGTLALVLRLQGCMTPNMFGCIGDGVTNDYDALMAAQVAKELHLEPDNMYATEQTIEVLQSRRIIGAGINSGFRWIGTSPTSQPSKDGGTAIIRFARPDPTTSALSNVYGGNFTVDLNGANNLIGTLWAYTVNRSKGENIQAIGLGTNCIGHYYSKLWYAGFDGMVTRGVSGANTIGHYLSAGVGQINRIPFLNMQALGCSQNILINSEDGAHTAIQITGESEQATNTGLLHIGSGGVREASIEMYFEGNLGSDVNWGGSSNGIISWNSCHFNESSSKVVISDGNHKIQGCLGIQEIEINGGNVYLEGNSGATQSGTGLDNLYFIPVITAIDTDQLFSGTGIRPKGGASSQVRSTPAIVDQLFPIPTGLISSTLPIGGRVIKVSVVGRVNNQTVSKIFEGYITQTSDTFWRIKALSTSTANDSIWDVGVGFVTGDIKVSYSTVGDKVVTVSFEPF